MIAFSIGDGVVSADKRSIYHGCKGLIQATTDNLAPFDIPAVKVCFVMEGTVWCRPELLEPLGLAETAELKAKQEEFTAKRRNSGLY